MALVHTLAAYYLVSNGRQQSALTQVNIPMAQSKVVDPVANLSQFSTPTHHQSNGPHCLHHLGHALKQLLPCTHLTRTCACRLFSLATWLDATSALQRVPVLEANAVQQLLLEPRVWSSTPAAPGCRPCRPGGTLQRGSWGGQRRPSAGQRRRCCSSSQAGMGPPMARSSGRLYPYPCPMNMSLMGLPLSTMPPVLSSFFGCQQCAAPPPSPALEEGRPVEQRRGGRRASGHPSVP
jgi:hypothetical protein